MKREGWPWVAVLALAGCATSTLSVEDAKQYAGLSINEFLGKRFGDGKAPRGAVQYKAYFNDVNYTQLQRPTTELVNFCKAQGGNPERVKPFTGNPFASYYKSPFVAGVQGAAYARSRGANESIANSVGQDVEAQAKAQNEEVDRRSKGYRISKDMYGDWTCQGAARPWTVSVVPVQFIPQPASQTLPVDVMMIDIQAR